MDKSFSRPLPTVTDDKRLDEFNQLLEHLPALVSAAYVASNQSGHHGSLYRQEDKLLMLLAAVMTDPRAPRIGEGRASELVDLLTCAVHAAHQASTGA